MLSRTFEKARWGKDGGLGGKGNTSRASSDRRRPQAVPVATQEATGIDSRDEGFPLPPINYGQDQRLLGAVSKKA